MGDHAMLKILVTGASGFLGRRLVQRLSVEGCSVRALVRPSSNLRGIETPGTEIALGDMADYASIERATMGVDVVVHAAAGTRGDETESYVSTVQGTRNVLTACGIGRIKKLIYISSCSVYGIAGCHDAQVITEESPLEISPEKRGRYSAAKQQAEALVTESLGTAAFPIVVLRPGTLYGPGGTLYSPMMGARFSRRLFVVFGDGTHALPLLHVDNLVDAVVSCITSSAADNQIFNVLDQETVSKNDYVDRVMKPLYPDALFVRLPIPLLLILTRLQERVATLIGRAPLLTAYRLISSQKPVRYSAAKLGARLGWRPPVTFRQGSAQLVSQGKSG
jgi:nucleoside-diphosphate-sugar epimerase